MFETSIIRKSHICAVIKSKKIKILDVFNFGSKKSYPFSWKWLPSEWLDCNWKIRPLDQFHAKNRKSYGKKETTAMRRKYFFTNDIRRAKISKTILMYFRILSPPKHYFESCKTETQKLEFFFENVRNFARVFLLDITGLASSEDGKMTAPPYVHTLSISFLVR